MDGHAISLRSKRLQVPEITAEHGAPRLGGSDDNGVHGRPPPGKGAQRGSATCARLWQHDPHIARLEELVGPRIPVRPATKALDKDNAGHDRRP